MAIYATADSEDGKINLNADIQKFTTIEDAQRFLLTSWDWSEWDHSTAKFGAGSFGDCWQKNYAKPPRVADNALSPFAYPQLSVQKPGQHPGGKCWWVTPIPEVLVLISIEALEPAQ